MTNGHGTGSFHRTADSERILRSLFPGISGPEVSLLCRFKSTWTFRKTKSEPPIEAPIGIFLADAAILAASRVAIAVHQPVCQTVQCFILDLTNPLPRQSHALADFLQGFRLFTIQSEPQSQD